jgi:hypothetical protein
MRASQDKRQSRKNLGQWRMLAVQAKIEFLEIAHPSPNMCHFVQGDRLTKRGATRQERHQHQEHNGDDEEPDLPCSSSGSGFWGGRHVYLPESTAHGLRERSLILSQNEEED